MEKIKEAKLKQKISVTDTLLNMNVGETVSIKINQIKAGVVRTSVSRLNANGYRYTVSEAGRIDDIVVTRFK